MTSFRPTLSTHLFCGSVALLFCSAIISLGQTASPPASAQSQVMTTTTPSPSEAPQTPAFSNDQLDSLVAPIALYSDDLLANTLAASTYPLEVIQMQQWMDQNKKLKEKALADAVAKQNWDPSVQSLAATPEVLQRMAGNIQWTTDLGNAFLAQQSDVMDAVQRMRAKAQGKGTLKTSSQQKVEARTVENGKNVIVIQNADPQVVYVPSYDPAVVYGPPTYPYYPYYYPGWYAGMGLALGAGIAWGAYWGNHWGDCDWGHGDVNINNNNNFNRNNWNNNNRPGGGGNRPGNRPGGGNRPSQMPAGGKWGHNPSHRGNAPYGDRRTNDKFGQGNRGQGNRGQANRPSQLPSGGNRPGAGAGNRPSTRPSGGNRPGGGNAGARPATRPSGGSSANRVGNRSASSRSYGNRGGGFGGGSGNYARASSSRGGRSMGGGGFSRGGGGGFGGGGRGGGGRGGGGRGGGGGRR